MFTYFLLTNNGNYSTTSIPTEVSSLNDLGRDRSVTEDQYAKLLQKYDQLKSKYERVKHQNAQLKDYVNQLEDVFKPDGKKRKIKRRPQSELTKEHSCPYAACKKEYASTLALNLHIRSKHQGGTKKERIQFIKQLIEAEEKGFPAPTTTLKLCPELLEMEIKNYKQRASQENPNVVRPNRLSGSSSQNDQ